jgi:nitric oxide reductase subunit C
MPPDPRVLRVLCAAVVALVLSTVLGDSGAQTPPPAAGDAKRGEQLFARLPCASCHDIRKRAPGGDVCPNLGNIATEAGRKVRRRDYRGKARDAAGYIRESILEPNAYIVPGKNYRMETGRSVMPEDVGGTMSPAELDDLVAFLLTRR